MGKKNAYEKLIMKVTEKRHNLLPIKKKDLDAIDELIGSLGQVQGSDHSFGDVLRLRLGLDGPKLTLEEIGKRFGVTKEAIRQQQEKAFRLLRHPQRIKFFQQFYLNFEAPLQPKSPLLMKVDELLLSGRIYNCLTSNNIKTVKELIQRTPSQLLNMRNFGRKSLKQLKKELEKHGLHLGMKVD